MKIERLLIKNSPAFNEVILVCNAGLNVISGASGAGKSVFFHSLLALFGLKDCNALSLEATLEGEVDIEEYPQEDELLLQVFKKEKTRYFLNHQSASKKRFESIFSPYIKWLSHKNSNELESVFLLGVLDSQVKENRHLECVKDYKEKFLEYLSKQNQLKELKEMQKKKIELKEFAQFEIERIEGINPKIGEYEELLDLKKKLSKKERLQEQATLALKALEQMQSVTQFLNAVEKNVDGYDEMLCELESLIVLEKDKLDELDESNPEELLDRIASLSSLISRYGGIEEALQRLQEQKEHLNSYENLDLQEKELASNLVKLQSELEGLAGEINQQRQKALPMMQELLGGFGTLLKLENIHLDLSKIELHKMGYDFLEIKVGDSAPVTLSSGEYNRLRLAVLAMEKNSGGGIVLLDEIDANLSGEESEGVAKVLCALAKHYQVFAISHQPHLPAVADAHFLVKKSSEGSIIIELNQEGRVQEIARMISGSELSQEALSFARKKLQGV